MRQLTARLVRLDVQETGFPSARKPEIDGVAETGRRGPCRKLRVFTLSNLATLQ
jgi:hypothetical protein